MATNRHTSNIIDAHGLTKRFGDFTAVDHVDFHVNQGEIFAFLGPNGAGKSTTIKMLTTLIRPTDGEVYVAGHNTAHDQNAVRKAFGIVFQDPSLDDELTACENMRLHGVLYGLSAGAYSKRAQELLQLVELWDRRNSLVKTFSGGMKRRLEIARGLLHHPKILFLDEPTIGLDAQTRNLLWQYVQKLNNTENMTIFMTTHYIEEAEMVADRIAIIDHGRIIATGTSAELTHQTNTAHLEAAYLKLTGKNPRDEMVGTQEAFRMRARIRGGRR